MKKKILAVIAVHPDDETLGCGGTILKYAKEKKYEVHWIICTEINNKHSAFLRKKYQNRRYEIKKVQKKLNISKVHKLNFPSAMLYQLDKGQIILKISQLLKDIKPEILIIPFLGDVHSDHKIISESITSSLKSFKVNFINRILMMEVLSETEQNLNPFAKKFNPNYFVDISKYIKQKVKTFEIYKTEVQKNNQPRNEKLIIALSKLRGSQINVNYAEAFMALKIKD